MSEKVELDAKLVQRNRVLGLVLFGLVILIGVVSYLKIEMVTP